MKKIRKAFSTIHDELREKPNIIITYWTKELIGILLRINPVGACNFPTLLNQVNENGRTYGHIVSADRVYQPWEDDLDFLFIWKKIKNNTMNDKIRAYRIYKAIENVETLNGAIVEVGTFRGGLGCLMAKKAKNDGINSNVYLCDTFEGIVKSGNKDSYFNDGQLSNSSPKHIDDLSNKLDINPKVLQGTFPEETAHKIEEDTIRLAHIDVDVYESTKASYEWIWPRLCKGGLIFVDDYGWEIADGVTTFVEEISGGDKSHILYLLNYQAIIIKI